MITQLQMNAVASFKQASTLETDKKINLIYGLNGTGKSTISNYLYEPHDSAFRHCKKTQDHPIPILVYNQRFIQDNFFVADSLNGIFSLSNQNKKAEQRIANATEELARLEQSLQAKRNSITQVTKDFESVKQQAVNEVWKIKSAHAGGDRVLEYCLEGLKGQKDKLFTHLQSIKKPSNEPTRGTQEIRKDVEALKGEAAKPKQRLSMLVFQAHEVENNNLVSTSILGNNDSEVAALIEQLGNTDWVKQGLAYLPDKIGDAVDALKCPFCQASTITEKFIENVELYFDTSYQKQLGELDSLLGKYRTAINNLPDIDDYTGHSFIQERKSVFEGKYQLLVAAFRKNIEELEKKIKSPKIIVTLSDTTDIVSDFNKEVTSINKEIDAYNNKLLNRETTLAKLGDEFWSLMRWQYDQTIARFEQDQHSVGQKVKNLKKEIDNISAKTISTKHEIKEAQKQTVNVDTAVDAINAGLIDLGINDFSVQKHKKNRYRVMRSGDSNNAFHTLSEGEKMMISFLYFCELCKGKLSIEDTQTQRIVVIDDPISSLSHIFIFNVGQLIRTVFFRGDRYCQVIVLTHSLYFFYELTDPNHERRKLTQKLFRLSKSSTGSDIQEMKYEEIQNDYQAYWSVVNDVNQPPALIANCMRNIIEYFFNFVRKKDLSNVIQMPEFQDNKYQSFCRYINRESHSLGQNIIDMKEFDYKNFKEGLRLIFERAGYPEHYEAMAKC